MLECEWKYKELMILGGMAVKWMLGFENGILGRPTWEM